MSTTIYNRTNQPQHLQAGDTYRLPGPSVDGPGHCEVPPKRAQQLLREYPDLVTLNRAEASMGNQTYSPGFTAAQRAMLDQLSESELLGCLKLLSAGRETPPADGIVQKAHLAGRVLAWMSAEPATIPEWPRKLDKIPGKPGTQISAPPRP